MIIGIDPGCGRNTGVCLLDDQGKVANLVTCSPDQAKELLRGGYSRGIRDVGIEYSASYHIYSRKNAGVRATLKIAQNVAENRCLAESLIGFAEGLGYRVYRVKPYKTKMNANWFRDETGWKGRTSSHARDAYLVATRAEYMRLTTTQ